MAEIGETKTYCIGRFLVDVPAEFELVRHDGSVRGLDIERVSEGNQSDLERVIAERVRAIRSGEVGEVGQDPDIFLGTEQLGRFTVIKRILDTSIMGVQLSEPWSEEVFVLSGGAIFRLEGAGIEADIAEYREDTLLLANAVHPRASDEIPAGSGTCLEDSFFAVPPGNEHIGAAFAHSSNRSIELRITALVRSPSERRIDFSAIEGSDGERTRIAGFDGKELRLWDNQINLSAIVGQQTSSSRPGYKLTLEYSDARSELGTEPVTREDAERIWEAFTGSIRIKR